MSATVPPMAVYVCCRPWFGSIVGWPRSSASGHSSSWPASLRGRWRAEIERGREIRLRNFDSDAGRIDSSAAVDPVGHRPRPEDDDDDQNYLQEHPGNGAPIDLRRLDRPRRDAAQ